MNKARRSKTVATRRSRAVSKAATRRAASKAKVAAGRRHAPADQPYSTEDAEQVLKLLKGATSVELKLSVPAEGHRAAARAIGLDPVEAQPRQAFFFDTADLALSKAGLVVRARRFPRGRADTVIKRRPVDPATIDLKLRRSDSFKVELDAMPGGAYVCSASFKGACSSQEVLDAATGTAPLRSLFSSEQLAFYDAHAPKGVTMDKLLALGPILLLRAKHEPKDFAHRIVVELWLYPDGSHILEVSTKCLPEEAFQVGAEFRAYITNCGMTIGTVQEAKTRAALQYFKARLDAGLPVG
jgi:hypothetical protein